GGGGGGGGSPPPTITLAALPHMGTQPLTYLYLSQIPYTGLDLGPVGTFVYWAVLILGALIVTYVALFGVVPFANRSLRDFAARVSLLLNAQELVPAPVAVQESPRAPEVSEVLNQSTDPIPEAPRAYSSYDGFKSFAQNGALSIEDLVKGLSRTTSSPPVSRTVSPAVKTEPLYDRVEPPVENVEPSIPPVSVPADVRGLTSALAHGDRGAVFAGLRQHVRGGGSPERLVSAVACILDDTYRARIDGSPCDTSIARLTARLDTPSLEKLVSALTTAIDSSYTDGLTGAKIAFTRALSVLGV
ncbi:MAG TPA: hypothetical protein VMV38_02190, partial [Candidatus Paceibacterota bacterium]|nr:hypothetical protein [Candidatus Paceibacterota bacterium]